MKYIFLILAICTIALGLPAQSNAPVRLAMVSETDEAAVVADVLTANLSNKKNLQLLERNEIEKVYREQGLSAGNKDYLKLGQILGADGLLLMETVKEGTNQFLNVRLVAVKPGVVLAVERFPWPMKDPAGWSEIFARQIGLYFPKLTVLAKDAIPISIVNLRSAVSSTEAQETERQLKLLTIQRLSREKQLFVLERQRMQLLAEEKGLKLDDSAFWNGSYLLEGIVDQNGYSPETITLNVQLAPPKGGTMRQFVVSGSRTNLVEVVNQMAANVNAALKVNSAADEWNAADEAAQYFNEAQWALRWGIYLDAQAAAESAWALGKHDMDCATIRIKAYAFATGRKIIGEGGYDKSTASSVEETDRDWIVRHLKTDGDEFPGILYVLHAQNATTPIISLEIYNSPTPQSLEHAIRAMDLYRDFSQTLSASANHSAWYELGIDNLTMASEVLQHFYLVPKSQNGEVEKLTELRALCRLVAAWISISPEVHERYKRCEMAWGCFWQEKPEDGVIFYRDYLTDPALDRSSFAHFQEDLRARELDRPRLISWSNTDRKRAPIVWDQLVQELGNSTNEFLQAEAKVLRKIGFSGLNSEEIIPKYLEYWQGLRLKNKPNPESASAPTPNDKNTDDDIFHQPGQILNEQEQRGQLKAQLAKQQVEKARRRSEFEQRIIYLHTQTNLEPRSFTQIMFNFDYSSEEAGELLPSLTNFEARIIESKQEHAGNVVQVFKHKLDNIISPPSRKTAAQAPVVNRAPAQNHASKISLQPPSASFETATNILLVNNFYGIPQEPFWGNVFVWPGEESNHGIRGERVWNHSWQDGKLVLAVKYSCSISNSSYSGENIGAAVIFDPTNHHWETILYPRNPADSQHDVTSLTMFQGNIYLVDNELVIRDGNQQGNKLSIKKHDSRTTQWETLGIQFPDNFVQTTIYQGPSRLFVVNDHLYAANFQSIFEITDDGHGTHLLANIRRRPAVSALDSLNDLGSPTLFAGPNNSLWACVWNQLYYWDANDWHKAFDFGTEVQADIFGKAAIFRTPQASGYRPSVNRYLWMFQQGQNEPTLCLCEKPLKKLADNQQTLGGQTPNALWQLSGSNSLVNAGGSVFESNLVFFVDHANVINVLDQHHWEAKARDGYHAQLVCRAPDCPDPIIIPVKFDTRHAQPPLASLVKKIKELSSLEDLEPTWLLFTGDTLYIGQPATLGVWSVSISEVEAAMSTQKQIQITQALQTTARKLAAQESLLKYLMEKYDINHNGVIDPDEKMAALDDPAFIESELKVIDANHNGRLDAVELIYFDADNNKTLELKEQAGIEIAQRLLAESLLKRYDANGDGALDPLEFSDLVQSGPDANPQFMSGFPVPSTDEDHDGKIELAELEGFLNQHLRNEIRVRGAMGTAYFRQAIADPGKKVDARQLFKTYVELYWQNSTAAHKELSDEERHQVLQQLMQKRNAETSP